MYPLVYPNLNSPSISTTHVVAIEVQSLEPPILLSSPKHPIGYRLVSPPIPFSVSLTHLGFGMLSGST